MVGGQREESKGNKETLVVGGGWDSEWELQVLSPSAPLPELGPWETEQKT